MDWDKDALPEILFGGYIDHLVDVDVWPGLPDEAKIEILQSEIKKNGEEMNEHKRQERRLLDQNIEMTKELSRLKTKVKS